MAFRDESATSTKVSKAHPAIKALLSVTFPQWRGKQVTVIEAGAYWAHTVYHDDLTTVFAVDVHTLDALKYPRPVAFTSSAGWTPGNSARTYTTSTYPGRVLVMWSRFMGSDMGVEIVVPAGTIDQIAMAIAVDRILEMFKVCPVYTRAKLVTKATRTDVRKVFEGSDTASNVLGIAMAMAEQKAHEMRMAEITSEAQATFGAQARAA